MNDVYRYMYIPIDNNNIPIIDIQHDNINTYNIDKLYRTVIRIIFSYSI